MYKIGVVGYSSGKFDVDKAREHIEVFLDMIRTIYLPLGRKAVIVSGLTNLGIPALAYEYALANNLTTIGVACKRASEFEVFPCDIVEIVGDDWGDESETFLNQLDCILRIGGGQQSLAEVRKFYELFPGKPIFEVELERHD